MPQFNYTIPELLKLIGIRGYTPRAANAVNRALAASNDIEYQESMREATQEITGYDGIDIRESDTDTFSDRSQFGLPIWMPLILQATGNIASDLLLDSAIVTVSQSRNIVKTAVQGLDGTVKEYISDGDYQVSVTGLLANRSAAYPKAQVSSLKDFLALKQSFSITSEILNNIGIYDVVVDSWNLPPTPLYNCQSYSFTLSSDRPVELFLR